MTEQTDSHEADEDRENKELGDALLAGIALGTPVTFLVFFLLVLLLADTTMPQAIVPALWAGLVGGGFYGGLAGMLHVLNKQGH
ncbi:MAG: hypothetical protein OEO77_01425 [Acidimicrobiia bacterium]|nr:hypothetical protein [Acidimicrobiia bacterium]